MADKVKILEEQLEDTRRDGRSDNEIMQAPIYDFDFDVDARESRSFNFSRQAVTNPNNKKQSLVSATEAADMFSDDVHHPHNRSRSHQETMPCLLFLGKAVL